MQRELLSLSPKARSQVGDNVTTHQIPKEVVSIDSGFQEEDYNKEAIFHFAQAPILITSFRIHRAHQQMPLDGSIIIDNPIEQYYQSLHPDEEPDPECLKVGTTSFRVCSIFALIDNNQKKGCILNPGCQMVAILENSCHDLGLVYNPTIVLYMQSTNGNINWSLGMFLSR